MGRSSVENKDANQQMQANQKRSFKTAQSSIDSGKEAFAKLGRGENIAPDPFQSTGYLSNVNKLEAGALNSENDAADFEMNAENRRTGGLNTSGTLASVKDLALKKMRLADILGAERGANDFRANIGYQQQQLENTYKPAELEAPYYATATGGRDAALKNLTDLGIAKYGPWMAGIQAAGGAASAGIAKIGA